jgi:hypothetical protein
LIIRKENFLKIILFGIVLIKEDIRSKNRIKQENE